MISSDLHCSAAETDGRSKVVTTENPKQPPEMPTHHLESHFMYSNSWDRSHSMPIIHIQSRNLRVGSNPKWRLLTISEICLSFGHLVFLSVVLRGRLTVLSGSQIDREIKHSIRTVQCVGPVGGTNYLRICVEVVAPRIENPWNWRWKWPLLGYKRAPVISPHYSIVWSLS